MTLPLTLDALGNNLVAGDTVVFLDGNTVVLTGTQFDKIFYTCERGPVWAYAFTVALSEPPAAVAASAVVAQAGDMQGASL